MIRCHLLLNLWSVYTLCVNLSASPSRKASARRFRKYVEMEYTVATAAADLIRLDLTPKTPILRHPIPSILPAQLIDQRINFLTYREDSGKGWYYKLVGFYLQDSQISGFWSGNPIERAPCFLYQEPNHLLNHSLLWHVQSPKGKKGAGSHVQCGTDGRIFGERRGWRERDSRHFANSLPLSYRRKSGRNGETITLSNSHLALQSCIRPELNVGSRTTFS